MACGVPRFSLPPWRAAGVCVPVFALRSAESWGIGDFGDLKRMVDWAASVGLRVVQLLPVNDTTASHTWADSYPYNALSVFALNPLIGLGVMAAITLLFVFLTTLRLKRAYRQKD